MNASDLFAAALTEATIDLNQMTEGARRKVLRILTALHEDLAQELGLLGLDDSTLTANQRKIRRLSKSVKAVIDKRFALTSAGVTRVLLDIAELTQDRTVKMINDIFTVNLGKAVLNKAELRALVSDTVVLGEPTAEWWVGQAEATRRKYMRDVRQGIQRGDTTQDILSVVRGKFTGKTLPVKMANGRVRMIRQYAGGSLDVTVRQADALLTTAVQSVANEAMRQTYKGNEDILRGYGAITTLDGRTSPICMARTGGSWDLKGAPLPESETDEGFPGWPPWHYRCRTVLGPITKTWEQLEKEAGSKRRKLLNTVPDSVKVSFDGQVGKEVKSFDDWLRVRGDGFAKRKLGPTLFQLWKDDKITTRSLIDQRGRPRTVKDIRKALGLSG